MAKRTLQERINQYLEKLQATLEEAWPAIIAECLADISAGSPTPSDEYKWIMFGNEGGTPAGVAIGERHTDPGDRQQFIRIPGMWIKDAVLSPQTWSSNTGNLSISIGNVAALEELTKFSWRNKNNSQYQSPYGVWSWFEYGRNEVRVTPRGGTYPLQPDNQHEFLAMDKSYPAYRMYGNFDKLIFRQAVLRIARTVKF